MTLPLQSWFLKLHIKKYSQTEIGKGDVCELQELGVVQETLRRSTPQVHRPSKFKELILSLKAQRLFYLHFILFTSEARIHASNIYYNLQKGERKDMEDTSLF